MDNYSANQMRETFIWNLYMKKKKSEKFYFGIGKNPCLSLYIYNGLIKVKYIKKYCSEDYIMRRKLKFEYSYSPMIKHKHEETRLSLL